jgi:hypothetical protein
MNGSTPRISHVFDPNRWTNILGIGFARHEHRDLLVIGAKRWDYYHLCRLGCGHAISAGVVTRVCKEMGITTLAGLAKHIREIGNFKGVGTVAYALMLAILGEAGYDIDAVHGEDRTFISIKAQARRAVTKEQKKRKRPRRAGPPSEMKDATL